MPGTLPLPSPAPGTQRCRVDIPRKWGVQVFIQPLAAQGG